MGVSEPLHLSSVGTTLVSLFSGVENIQCVGIIVYPQ